LSDISSSAKTSCNCLQASLNYNEKAPRETQTLRAGCSKAEPKIFAPLQTPFQGVQDCQNLISWRWSLPLHTDPVWWGSMQAISSYCGNRPTNTNPQTGPITIHCISASVQCKNSLAWQLCIQSNSWCQKNMTCSVTSETLMQSFTVCVMIGV